MSITKKEIDSMLASGMSPKKINEHSQQSHRIQIEAEIADGKWRCPACGQPLKLKPDANILYCDRHGGESL
jgi:hypothetical protein